MRQQLITQLHEENCSCVIYNAGQTRTFHQRGVKDLHQLLSQEPEILNGATLADKGKRNTSKWQKVGYSEYTEHTLE